MKACDKKRDQVKLCLSGFIFFLIVATLPLSANAQEKDGSLLFSIDVKFQTDLDRGSFSEELRGKFERHGITVAQTATISVVENDSNWRIDDKANKQAYTISREADKLNIYAGAKQKAKIDLFVIIDVSKSIAPGASTPLQEIVNRLFASEEPKRWFNPGDRACIVLVAGDTDSICDLTPLQEANIEGTLKSRRDRVIEIIAGDASGLRPELTDLTKAFKLVGKEVPDQPASEFTNRAVLLVSDGNNDTYTPQRSNPPEIEEREELKKAVAEVLGEKNITFFMFHLVPPGKRDALYKNFWSSIVETYGKREYHHEIPDQSFVKPAVRNMFDDLRKISRIVIRAEIEKGAYERLYTDRDINLVWIQIQCESKNINRHVTVEYSMNLGSPGDDREKISPLLPEPATIIIPPKAKSLSRIPVTIAGRVKNGKRYKFELAFTPLKGYEDVNLISTNSLEIKGSDKRPRITFFPAKKHKVFFFSKAVVVKTRFQSPVSGGKPVVISFWTDDPLPKIRHPEGDSFELEKGSKVRRFIFDREALLSGVDEAELHFSSENYKVVGRDGQGSLSLHFYIPSGWYYFWFGLWVLALLSLVFMLFLYLRYQKRYEFQLLYQGPTSPHQSLRNIQEETATIGNRCGKIPVNVPDVEAGCDLLLLEKVENELFISRLNEEKTNHVKVRIVTPNQPEESADQSRESNDPLLEVPGAQPEELELQFGKQQSIAKGQIISIGEHPTIYNITLNDVFSVHAASVFTRLSAELFNRKSIRSRIPNYVWPFAATFFVLLVASLVWQNILPDNWSPFWTIFWGTIALAIISAITYVIYKTIRPDDESHREDSVLERRMVYFQGAVAVINLLGSLLGLLF